MDRLMRLLRACFWAACARRRVFKRAAAFVEATCSCSRGRSRARCRVATLSIGGRAIVDSGNSRMLRRSLGRAEGVARSRTW